MNAPEEWRPVPNWPGYEASSLGRIRSFRAVRTGRILRGSVNDRGYDTIGLYDEDGRLHIWTRHRIIATTFLGPRPDGLEVRHLDGDSLNCALSNIRYGTHSENMQDQIRHGTHYLARKTSCKRGHPFDEANTYRCANGKRQCRACKHMWETDREAWARDAKPNVRQASAA